MKTNTMRGIDRYFGSPLCHVLALLTPLLVGRRPSPKSVVLCKFFGLGSICLSYPLIRELQRQGFEITFLTFQTNDPLIQIIGVDRTICIEPKSLFGFVSGVLRSIWILRRVRPAAFLNLEFFSRFAALMTLLSGAPVRAGFHINHLPVGKLYTHRTNLNVYRPIFENYLNVGMSAGVIENLCPFAPDQNTLHFPAQGQPVKEIGSRYYVINAESSETVQWLRSWPKQHWTDLIDQLRATRPEITLVLLGTNSSIALYDKIVEPAKTTDGIVNLAGSTNFADMVHLIRGAEMIITVDSGPFHISALFARKTIGLFGPETPVLYGYKLPWVRNIHKNLMCSPCLALYDAKKSVLECSDNQCLKQISTAQVMAEIEALSTGLN